MLLQAFDCTDHNSVNEFKLNYHGYFTPTSNQKELRKFSELVCFWWCWNWRQGRGHSEVSILTCELFCWPHSGFLMWILINNRATSRFTSLGYRQLPGLTVQNCLENPKGLDPSSVVNTGSRIHSHQSPDYDAHECPPLQKTLRKQI